MIQVAFTPQWFYGKDIAIDILSISVLFLIGFASLRYYKLIEKRNYLFLAISFFMLGIAFMFKILMNFTIYYHVLETHSIGFMTLAYSTVKSTDTLFFIGYFVYRFLTLLSLFLLYIIYKKQSGTNVFLIIYLLFIATYYTQHWYYIFHLTSMILLGLITIELFKNCKKNKISTSYIYFISFLIITISQLIFIYIKMEYELYVIAEITQLVGYILLLTAFIKVLRNGKKN